MARDNMKWHEKTRQGTRRHDKAQEDTTRHKKTRQGTGTRARRHGMFLTHESQTYASRLFIDFLSQTFIEGLTGLVLATFICLHSWN